MKQLICGCGFIAPAKSFPFEQHTNNTCGNDYVVTHKCEKVYIIFTRHELSREQWGDIHSDAADFGGIEECEVISLQDLASIEIKSLDDAEEILNKLIKYVKSAFKMSHFVEIYGVIPVPLRFLINEWNNDCKSKDCKLIHINESFNINRSKEGEKPSFQHHCWLPTGILLIPNSE